MPFVVLQIRTGAKPLKRWYGCVVAEATSLTDVFADFSSGALDGGNAISDDYRTAVVEARVGKTKTDLTQVSPQCSISDVVSALGQYVEFSVEIAGPSACGVPSTSGSQQPQNVGTQNAFMLLMASSRQNTSLPSKWEIKTPNKKLEMKNDVIDFLEKNKLGWDPSHAQQCGATFVNTLVESMWYIDGNHKALSDRGYPIPAMFEAFEGYNKPESRKKRKRSHENMKASELEVHSSALFSIAGSCYMKHRNWRSVREAVLRLAENLRQYSDYLKKQCEIVAGEAKQCCSRTDVDELTVLKPTLFIKPTLAARYNSLHAALLHESDFQPVLLEDHCPADPRRKHDYKEGIVVPVKSVMYTYTGSRNHITFIWKIPTGLTETELLQKNVSIQQQIKSDLPKYHSRAMRREFIHIFGTVTHTKPAFLRAAYRRLTGDASAASSTEQAEVDSRIAQLLDSEDPDLLWDLRVLNEGRPETFTVFLENCWQYLESSVETAVDERRHDTVEADGDVITHLAKALSVRDLYDEVTKKCPPGTPIPSVQWLRYQFWPRKPTALTSKRYKGNLKIKFMVQSRQFRHSHIDSHYASALFKYEKEFAIRYRTFTTFICQDDKHTIKVGEPGYPVAAIDRGKAVLVGLNEKFVVGDHDFTRFSITPSVNFEVSIPEIIEETFYHGKVFVGLKDATFQHSSPIRHACELRNILCSRDVQPILLLYTDGGPDHRPTFISVQLALISLFLELNVDFLCAVRTPPYNSWKNPVERVMSVLNIALQGVGVVRNETNYDDQLKNCNNMKQVRELAKRIPEVEQAVLDSMEDTKALMYSLFMRLKLKDEPLQPFYAASQDDIRAFQDIVKVIDQSLDPLNTNKQMVFKNKKFSEFYESHCRARHYMFSVKKCGNTSCAVCKPPRLPVDIFNSVHHLPDPEPVGDRYREFSTSYGQPTSEKYRPSLAEYQKNGRYGMPFPPSAQYAKNVKVVVQCSDCSKWRVLYSKQSLKLQQRRQLEAYLDDLSYTCGSTFADVDCAENCVLRSVYMKQNLTCDCPTEIPYYSAGNEPICYYCGSQNELTENPDYYPLCVSCKGKEQVHKRTRTFTPQAKN